MKQIVEIVSKVSPNNYLVRSPSGKTFTVHSLSALHKGQSVLLINGIVSGTVYNKSTEIVWV